MVFKGSTPWNKGLTTKTDKRIMEYGRKISISVIGRVGHMKGKHFSEQSRKNMGRKKGCIPWNKDKTWDESFNKEKVKKMKVAMSKVHSGKKLSKKHRAILSKYNTNRIWSDERNKKISDYKKLNNPVKTFNVRKLISASKQGVSIEDWCGFTTGKIYDELFYCRVFRMKIKKRDNYICAICHNKDNRNIIHHIDANKQNTTEKNCIILCIGCHNKVHGKNFNFWKVNLTNVQLNNLIPLKNG